MPKSKEWRKHCKDCGKFTGKNGKHPAGKCESGFKGHAWPGASNLYKPPQSFKIPRANVEEFLKSIPTEEELSAQETTKKQIDGTYYVNMAIQPWELIARNRLDYFEGAAAKYLLRWRAKDGVIDLDKAIHYLERIKELALEGHYGEQFKKEPVKNDIDFVSPVQHWVVKGKKGFQ